MDDRQAVAADGGQIVGDDVDVEAILLDTIRDLNNGNEGAPVGTVVETVLAETDVRLDVLCDALRSAYGRGLLYRPEDTCRLVPAERWEG